VKPWAVCALRDVRDAAQRTALQHAIGSVPRQAIAVLRLRDDTVTVRTPPDPPAWLWEALAPGEATHPPAVPPCPGLLLVTVGHDAKWALHGVLGGFGNHCGESHGLVAALAADDAFASFACPYTRVLEDADAQRLLGRAWDRSVPVIFVVSDWPTDALQGVVPRGVLHAFSALACRLPEETQAQQVTGGLPWLVPFARSRMPAPATLVAELILVQAPFRLRHGCQVGLSAIRSVVNWYANCLWPEAAPPGYALSLGDVEAAMKLVLTVLREPLSDVVALFMPESQVVVNMDLVPGPWPCR
jgi:hypothetical protein